MILLTRRGREKDNKLTHTKHTHKKKKKMHKKHTDQQVYSSSEVAQSHNAERTKKNTRKKNKAILTRRAPQ